VQRSQEDEPLTEQALVRRALVEEELADQKSLDEAFRDMKGRDTEVQVLSRFREPKPHQYLMVSNPSSSLSLSQVHRIETQGLQMDLCLQIGCQVFVDEDLGSEGREGAGVGRHWTLR
jgi:hypothetical protein